MSELLWVWGWTGIKGKKEEERGVWSSSVRHGSTDSWMLEWWTVLFLRNISARLEGVQMFLVAHEFRAALIKDSGQRMLGMDMGKELSVWNTFFAKWRSFWRKDSDKESMRFFFIKSTYESCVLAMIMLRADHGILLQMITCQSAGNYLQFLIIIICWKISQVEVAGLSPKRFPKVTDGKVESWSKILSFM